MMYPLNIGILLIATAIAMNGSDWEWKRHPSVDEELWVIPGVLAGMPMPFIHPERRMAGGGPLAAFEDELPALHAAGIQAVVCLPNIPSDSPVYESAGFAFHCVPAPDGGAPTQEQADEFIAFVNHQRAASHPVGVHCEAGLGRTGTMLAIYLISRGDSAETAIRRVRTSESVAIETPRQIRFPEQYASRVTARRVSDPPPHAPPE